MENPSLVAARSEAYPKRGWESAVPVITMLFFVAIVSYEIALLVYSPKDRPLHFHSSLVLPYKPFLIAWSLLTVLSGIVLVAHTHLSAFLRRFSLLRKFWGSMMLTVLATMIGLGVVEISLRIFDPLGIRSFPIVLRFWEDMMIPDPELRYRLRPNAQVSFGGVEFKTNTDGMRDDEALTTRPKHRILVLGDSVALGNRVAKSATTFHLLEGMMGGREVVDVVNTATSSYNTVQQSRVLGRLGDTYAPDIVLLLYVDNDVGMDHELPFYPGEYWRQAAYFPRRVVQYSFIRHLLRLGLYKFVSGKESSQGSPRDLDGWKESRAALSEISQWCYHRDIPFLVVFYSMLDPQIGRQYFEMLSEVGAEIGFPVIDSKKYWSDRPLSDMHVAIVDTHLSPLGHLLLAQGLNEDLRRRYPTIFPPLSEP